jgi:hypothetical protein
MTGAVIVPISPTVQSHVPHNNEQRLFDCQIDSDSKTTSREEERDQQRW